MPSDPYETLGVSRSATAEEIRKAYRELARKHHPDLHPDDAAAKSRFQDVQNAFDVLNDPKKKEMFDRYGAFDGMPGGGPAGGAEFWSQSGSPFGGQGGPTMEFDLEDMLRGGGRSGGGGGRGGFADFFKQFAQGGGAGTSHAQATPQRGADLRDEITVPFATAVNGGEAQISVRRPNGKVEDIKVKVPAGVEDGQTIRLRGQGEVGAAGGKAGDIRLTIHVSGHPCFRRQGKQLYVIVPISLHEAMEGGKIDIPTPKGVVSLTVPPGTSSGKKLRIKGYGVAPANQTPGDLFAEVEIIVPESLSEQERHTIAEISRRHTQNPRGELRW